MDIVAFFSMFIGFVAIVVCLVGGYFFFVDNDDEAGGVAIGAGVVAVVCIIGFGLTASSLETPGLSSQDQSLIRTQLIQVHPEAQKPNWDTSHLVTYLDYSGPKPQYCTLHWNWDTGRKLAIWDKPDCADVAP